MLFNIDLDLIPTGRVRVFLNFAELLIEEDEEVDVDVLAL